MTHSESTLASQGGFQVESFQIWPENHTGCHPAFMHSKWYPLSLLHICLVAPCSYHSRLRIYSQENYPCQTFRSIRRIQRCIGTYSASHVVSLLQPNLRIQCSWLLPSLESARYFMPQKPCEVLSLVVVASLALNDNLMTKFPCWKTCELQFPHQTHMSLKSLIDSSTWE